MGSKYRDPALPVGRILIYCVVSNLHIPQQQIIPLQFLNRFIFTNLLFYCFKCIAIKNLNYTHIHFLLINYSRRFEQFH